MKITKPEELTTTLDNLENGDAFETYDEVWAGVYIKCSQPAYITALNGSDPDDEVTYCTRITDGKIIGFQYDEEVYPVGAELTIKPYIDIDLD